MIRMLCAAAGVVVVMGSGVTSGYESRVLTPDGSDRYMITTSASGAVTIKAPKSNAGSNLRQVYWRKGSQATRDSYGQVCATWQAFPLTSQPGLALAITRTSALTVTRNVWAAAYWTFNVHTWQGPEFKQVAQMDWSRVLLMPDGSYRPTPWRVCIRLFGRSLTTKLWFPASEPEPGWGDLGRTKTVAVPAQPGGKVGLYAGHLPAGTSMTYVGVTT